VKDELLNLAIGVSTLDLVISIVLMIGKANSLRPSATKIPSVESCGISIVILLFGETTKGFAKRA
jgi:hypothetical protein